jgi:hypothetical protein
MSFGDRDGRLRILFVDAYDTLARRGIIAPEQADAAKDLVDRVEELAPDELERRLRDLFSGAADRNGQPGGLEESGEPP